MRTFIKRALLGALIGGGLALGGAGLAHADETSGDDGLLSGTQAILGVDIPVTIGGNAVSVIGDSTSSGATTPAPAPAAPAPAPVAEATTSGDESIGGGTQVVAPITVPVTVGGNAVSVIGDSEITDATTTAPARHPAGGNRGHHLG